MNLPKLKILHLTFNMGIGGTEQVIRLIVENSNTERFLHELLCIDGAIGALGQNMLAKGFYVESIKRNPGIDFRLVRSIRRLIKQRKINILHCHQYTPYFYGAIGAIGTKARVIFTEHGRFYPDRHNFKRRFINPLLVMASAHITAISQATADAVAQYEYIGRDKIQVIYNGIKDIPDKSQNRDELARELSLSPDFRYIGTISRLEPIKNQTMMINAYDKIRRDIPRLKLVLIGDGAKRSDLEQLTKSLGIEQEIVFTGFLDNPQRFISLFEIFLLSSFSEGTSITLLEAMSLSRPCVVTDVGGNPELVIDEKTASIVPSDDTDSFADSISRLLTDDDKRRAFGNAGRQRFLNNFTATKMIAKYQELYADN